MKNNRFVFSINCPAFVMGYHSQISTIENILQPLNTVSTSVISRWKSECSRVAINCHPNFSAYKLSFSRVLPFFAVFICKEKTMINFDANSSLVHWSGKWRYELPDAETDRIARKNCSFYTPTCHPSNIIFIIFHTFQSLSITRFY